MEQQLAQLLAQVGVSWDALLTRVQSSPQQMLAHGAIGLAFLLTLAGAYARTMMPLRWLAAASGVAALAYALLAPAPITLLTAGLLLPLNLWRAVEVTRLTHRVRRAGVQADMAGVWLKPYMKSRRLKAGQLLFAKGDFADHLYMLVHGEAELAEIGRPLEARAHLRRDRAVLTRPDAHPERARLVGCRAARYCAEEIAPGSSGRPIWASTVSPCDHVQVVGEVVGKQQLPGLQAPALHA